MVTDFPWQVETVDGRVYAQFVLEIDAHFFAKTAPGLLGVSRVVEVKDYEDFGFVEGSWNA